jgi:hypothetical protein
VYVLDRQVLYRGEPSHALHTYSDSLNPRGPVSRFKTLEIRATQSLAVNLTNTSQILKNHYFKVQFCWPTFSEGRQKRMEVPRML